MNQSVLTGWRAKGDYYDPETHKVLLCAGQMMDQQIVDRLDVLDLLSTEVSLHDLEPIEPSQRWDGWGRKGRSAVAQAVLRPGRGLLRINGQSIAECFEYAPAPAYEFLQRLLDCNEVAVVLAEMDVIVIVEGSTRQTTQQPKAVAHAIARALQSYDEKLGKRLRKMGYGGVQVKDCRKF